MTGLTACVTLLAPRAAARFGPRVPIAVGQFLIVVGLLALAVAVALQAPVLLLAFADDSRGLRECAGDSDHHRIVGRQRAS